MTKRQTKRVKIYDPIPDDELHLIVFMRRSVIHEIFTSPKTKARYPLMVTIPDPKQPEKKRLLNLSAREEFYGRIPAMDPKRKVASLTAPEGSLEYRPSTQGS